MLSDLPEQSSVIDLGNWVLQNSMEDLSRDVEGVAITSHRPLIQFHVERGSTPTRRFKQRAGMV